ncbi:unnamed protein product [Rotaria sp. Silwood1]|nr:unnamed protein product [Rotaria sp. Silwood1]CAF3646226.1 unnamed protein product [Rotaria sp. Silwood1]CAF3650319.1 unnamed protein product [Rotaria sp. Silwood1]CAF4633434.1 unnamed protein product [Rotaria sp. Silwood1]CAF4705942.1 unnamed protein product [Rotaria sp. Silwood1]
MMATIVESKRKKPTLLLDNFRYTQEKIINTTIYWKCENRLCPGRAIQCDSIPSRMTNDITMKVMKLDAKKHIISLYTTSSQITPFTPMFHEMKTSLYKARHSSYPPSPRNIDHVNIEGMWSKTLNDESFVLHNLKHPIFGTLESFN